MLFIRCSGPELWVSIFRVVRHACAISLPRPDKLERVRPAPGPRCAARAFRERISQATVIRTAIALMMTDDYPQDEPGVAR
jgi:hypothetical protein